ncbi:RNA degradosome polyphosphate kinase [Helicobacter sp. MIT 00-7814]|uniref:RNA degradosome polyphosphate kinase n=1 Tax=unclassified Helicobacter TaxID=2593540 RepID=UPI000E1EBE4A|nr:MULTISPECIES: RNA degradosome polyphosphate kinase [unclassified Helicobacter]RDU53949.1 RNA degradosome polyphosphate kinase [Helicobacter sp. MIT 00-7814]RDU57086.1 RNA degradosome polyphosphate kinase [Helicobacter sp. MIT 99-10781]
MHIQDSRMYFNRELSWLRFNTRVLDEAKNPHILLLDALKFVAIYGTNLDEFYMIRVAGLKRLYASGITEVGADKLTPLQQLSAIRKYLHTEQHSLENIFSNIKTQLAKENLYIKQVSELNSDEKKTLKEYFINYLYPVIVPVLVDSTHPFPHLNNLSFAIALKFKNTEGQFKYGMIRIPRILPRFFEIESGVFVPLEEIVGEFAQEFFQGYEIVSYTPFRVTRNADMEIEEEEADDFFQIMSEGIKTRRKGEIVRLEIGENDKDLLEFVNANIKVDSQDIYTFKIPYLINLSGLWQIVGSKAYAHLCGAPYNPKILPPLDSNTNIFATLDSADALLFHPYESFDSVVNFIQTAAKDPDVLSIRMTLYRVGKNSPIVQALIEAAENNKQVTALVELKARFDEENNLHWAKRLEAAGAHVIYGISGLKVHAKIALVIKKVGGALKEYVHLSTGNYNPGTAKIYTDLSLLTSNKDFANDAIKLFHALSTGSAHKTMLQKLKIAPTQIKSELLSLIEGETNKGEAGRIIMKANAFVDIDIIQALYRASQAGVKVDLIVRGICCLRPGVKGVSENIRVFSIIGKYLEHARIYYFKNAQTPIYFASADIMPRNLERRIEILTPSLSEEISQKLLEILTIQLKDNTQMHELQSNGEYKKLTASANEKPLSSQDMFEEMVSMLYNAAKKSQVTKAKKLVKRMMGES